MAKAFNIKWTKGNEKLQKDNGGTYNIIGFGIPADYDFQHNGETVNTCPSALACRAVCYAKQGRYAMPNVIAARQHNLEMSQNPYFVDFVVADLERMRKVNTVRIHDSGDFYDQEYYDKWCAIATMLPEITFYAYTKTVNMDLWSHKPDNLKITQSLGGKHDENVNLDMPHSRIFATHEDRVNAGYVDGNVNDVPAIEGLVQIGLVYHGQRKLTDSQKRYFA
jgi:prepilin-type processing-associated H-X9-DG protein